MISNVKKLPFNCGGSRPLNVIGQRLIDTLQEGCSTVHLRGGGGGGGGGKREREREVQCRPVD